MKADVLRAVRVITHAWIKTKEGVSKDEVYDFVDGLNQRFDDQPTGILASVPLPRKATIIFTEENQ